VWVGFGLSAAMFITLTTFTVIAGLLGIRSYEQATTTREKIAAVLGIVLALAFWGLGTYGIYSAPQPGAPTFAANRVLSGHGEWSVQDGIFTVPEGTSVTVPTRLGNSISDPYGGSLETGGNLSPFAGEADGAVTYPPGSRMPNLTLHPPDGLNIQGNPTTVTAPTNLGNLIGPNQGNVLWSACCVINP
jgi:hypothetical protein